MLVLALDTATSRITAGVVELGATGAPRPRSRVDAEGSRAHAELLAPGIAAALTRAGVVRTDLDAVVCGLGPGPFTGLRVGLVTAAALGDGLGVPVHGVATHDALAVAAGRGAVLAVTDARRREVYWARVDVGPDGPRRLHGPEVCAPAALAARLDTAGAPGALGPLDRIVGDAADRVTDAAQGPPGPTPEALVAVAAAALRTGAPPAALTPLYLRRPDAVPPGAPKAVTR